MIAATSALLTILATAACSTTSSPTPNTSSTSAGSAVGGSFARVDPATVHGSSVVSFVDSGRHINAVVPRVASARNLSQAAEVIRERNLRLAHLDHAGSVTVQSQFIGASTDVLGLAVVSDRTVSGRHVVTPATIWYDATAAQSYSGSALISWKGWSTFADAVVKAAKDGHLDPAKVSRALADSAAPYGTGPAIGFDGSGNVLVIFASGVLADSTTTLSVPAAQAEPLLSPLGRRARAAATKPSSFRNPPRPTHAWTPPKEMPDKQHSPNLLPLPGDEAPAAGTSTHPSTAIGVDCVARRCVAVTYDDGPGPDTPTLLRTLDSTRTVATFFQMGNSINAYPATSRTVAASGFEIGNHTLTHPDVARLPEGSADHEIGGNTDLLKKVIGRTPLIFRPPYGSHSSTTDTIAAKYGMAVVQWSIDTNDWNNAVTHQDPQVVVAKASTFPDAYSQPIILMHDIHSWTVKAAPQVIRNLQNRGFTLVTVSELTLNTGGLRTGHAYCHGTADQQSYGGSWCRG